MGLTGTMGTLLGWGAGALALCLRNRSLSRVLVRHGWVYDVVVGKPNDVTLAHVMTNIKEGERVLLYSGFVKTFGLAPDGRFTYLVLHGALRYYMYLEKDGPRTMSVSEWKRIGQSTSSVAELMPPRTGTQREWSYFVIDGEDIANVMFDRHSPAPEALKVLPEVIRAVRESFVRRLVVRNMGMGFDPPTIVIERGGFVAWEFGAAPHNVTFTGSRAPSNVPTVTNGGALRAFPDVGDSPYSCTIHPGEAGLVRVVDSSPRHAPAETEGTPVGT